MPSIPPNPTRGKRRRSKRNEHIQRKSETDNLFQRKSNEIGLKLLQPGDTQKIHSAVKHILWDIGAQFDHAPTVHKLVNEHGCRLGANGYVQIPPDLIDQALSTVPSSIKLYDLDGKIQIDTSERITKYCPGHNCVRILDHETGELRQSTVEDIRRVAKVCNDLKHIDMTCSLGYPSDVDPEDEALETVKAMMENSRKPAAILAHDDHIQSRIWTHISEVAGGWDNLAEKPIALELMGPVSPLKLPDELCLRIINAANWRVPMVCYPATFPGMSSPISSAGAITQSSAEAIAGIVLHQLTAPGAPILSGSAVLPMDLRQANLAYGSPEYMLCGLGAADYFNSIGVPSWIGAGCSDSHQFDAQAAAEIGANMAIAAISGSSFAHNLGYLSGGRTGSLEALALCDELVGWSGTMATGIEVTPETIAVDVIERGVKNNDFLTDPHTQERFLTENWYPTLFERSDAEAWEAAGSRNMQSRIRDKLNDILA